VNGDASEVVLVVEDDPLVRRLSSDSLRELGYTVLESESAAAALEILGAASKIDLLFTDVVMPEMNGKKLVEEALKKRPGLKVLFTTGYTRNAVVHGGVLDPDVNFISKPFTIQQLASKVRAVLDA
jgi:CheY-like chemotaxis protein